jgi:hypothetical protein
VLAQHLHRNKLLSLTICSRISPEPFGNIVALHAKRVISVIDAKLLATTLAQLPRLNATVTYNPAVSIAVQTLVLDGVYGEATDLAILGPTSTGWTAALSHSNPANVDAASLSRDSIPQPAKYRMRFCVASRSPMLSFHGVREVSSLPSASSSVLSTLVPSLSISTATSAVAAAARGAALASFSLSHLVSNSTSSAVSSLTKNFWSVSPFTPSWQQHQNQVEEEQRVGDGGTFCDYDDREGPEYDEEYVEEVVQVNRYDRIAITTKNVLSLSDQNRCITK